MLIAPSILAADLADLGAAVGICADGGVELVHVDVMDGHFVPNLTFGPPVIEAMARRTDLALDFHLMVSRPEDLLDRYLELRPRWLSIHWEAAVHHDRLVQRIQAAGVGAGLALNPGTPISMLDCLLPQLDFVLVMSVNPGFAGQAFIPQALHKAEQLRESIDRLGLDTKIEMDGGVALPNVERVRDAGVDVAVVGSGIFGAEDPVGTARQLSKIAS